MMPGSRGGVERPWLFLFSILQKVTVGVIKKGGGLSRRDETETPFRWAGRSELKERTNYKWIKSSKPIQNLLTIIWFSILGGSRASCRCLIRFAFTYSSTLLHRESNSLLYWFLSVFQFSYNKIKWSSTLSEIIYYFYYRMHADT